MQYIRGEKKWISRSAIMWQRDRESSPRPLVLCGADYSLIDHLGSLNAVISPKKYHDSDDVGLAYKDLDEANHMSIACMLYQSPVLFLKSMYL